MNCHTRGRELRSTVDKASGAKRDPHPHMHPQVTEYCERGSLLDVLQAGRRSPTAAAQLTWGRRLSIALDSARGQCACLGAREGARVPERRCGGAGVAPCHQLRMTGSRGHLRRVLAC